MAHRRGGEQLSKWCTGSRRQIARFGLEPVADDGRALLAVGGPTLPSRGKLRGRLSDGVRAFKGVCYAAHALRYEPASTSAVCRSLGRGPRRARIRAEVASGGVSPENRRGHPESCYGFGAVRVAIFTLLTLTALSACHSRGVVTAKFYGNAVNLRSSPTVVADTSMSGSTSTCVSSGKLPSAI